MVCKFAAKLEFENIADCELVASGDRQCLQRGVVQVGIGWSKAAHGHSQRRLRAIVQCE